MTISVRVLSTCAKAKVLRNGITRLILTDFHPLKLSAGLFMKCAFVWVCETDVTRHTSSEQTGGIMTTMAYMRHSRANARRPSDGGCTGLLFNAECRLELPQSKLSDGMGGNKT